MSDPLSGICLVTLNTDKYLAKGKTKTISVHSFPQVTKLRLIFNRSENLVHIWYIHVSLFFPSLSKYQVKQKFLDQKNRFFLFILSSWWSVVYEKIATSNTWTHNERNGHLLLLLQQKNPYNPKCGNPKKVSTERTKFTNSSLPKACSTSDDHAIQMCISGICNIPCCKLLGKKQLFLVRSSSFIN